jgi:hypothetical protein
MLHLRVGLVLTAMGLMVACGDDDDEPKPSTSDAAVGAAGTGKAGSGGVMLRDGGMSSVNAGTGASGMSGTIQEGMPCNVANPCAPDLACVGIGLQNFSVCARPCTETDAATACEAGEVCGGYTNRPQDRHCLNLVDKEWEFCGPAETADCAEPLVCIRVPDDESTPEVEVIAICVLECTPNADVDAGLEMSTCATGQVCLPSGLCANLVERGGECSLGQFCEDATDQCLPDSLADIDNATYRCHQDCTEPDTMCEVGECVMVQEASTGEVYSFCLDEQ